MPALDLNRSRPHPHRRARARAPARRLARAGSTPPRSLLPASIVAGYALGALFAAPFVVYALVGFVSSKFSGDLRTYGGTDGDDFVVPNNVIELGGSSFHSLLTHMPSGESAYLGLPTLVIVALFAVRARRLPAARFVVAAFVRARSGHARRDAPSRRSRPDVASWWNAASALPGSTTALRSAPSPAQRRLPRR